MSRRWLAAARRRLPWRCCGFVVYEGYKVVESPSNQLFGKTLVSGPRDERVVALTYDDGPNPPYTDEIFSRLARGARARDLLRSGTRGRGLSARSYAARFATATRSATTPGATGTWCSTTAADCAERCSAPIARSSQRPACTRASCARRTAGAIGWCSARCASSATRR